MDSYLEYGLSEYGLSGGLLCNRHVEYHFDDLAATFENVFRFGAGQCWAGSDDQLPIHLVHLHLRLVARSQLHRNSAEAKTGTAV